MHKNEPWRSSYYSGEILESSWKVSGCVHVSILIWIRYMLLKWISLWSRYHTSVCITALSWRAVTTFPSKETKPENVFQLLLGVQSMGPDFWQTEVYMLLKKQLRMKEKMIILVSLGNMVLPPLQYTAPTARRHRTRSNAEKGHQGVAGDEVAARETTPYDNFLAR